MTAPDDIDAPWWVCEGPQRGAVISVGLGLATNVFLGPGGKRLTQWIVHKRGTRFAPVKSEETQGAAKPARLIALVEDPDSALPIAGTLRTLPPRKAREPGGAAVMGRSTGGSAGG